MDAFPNEYVPTTFDNFNAVYEFEGANIFLGLWDTAGQQDFEKLRPISYKESDIYLMFFFCNESYLFGEYKIEVGG